MPPSTLITCPVTKSERSVARKLNHLGAIFRLSQTSHRNVSTNSSWIFPRPPIQLPSSHSRRNSVDAVRGSLSAARRASSMTRLPWMASYGVRQRYCAGYVTTVNWMGGLGKIQEELVPHIPMDVWTAGRLRQGD